MSELTPRVLLTESVWCELHESTQQYLTEWHTEVLPLLEEYCALYEAELTSDQIQAIFRNAEQYAVDSKQYMTKLGKAGTAVKVSAQQAKALNDKIKELAKKAQNSAPIENFDAKFEQLKADMASKLGGDSSKIVAAANKLGQAAKDNPVKAAFVIGLFTVAGAVAAGPAGAAGVGFLMRAGRDVLAGEKLSTAVGRSIKTAAIAGLAGFTMDSIGDMISDSYRNLNPVPLSSSQSYETINIGNGLPSIFQDASIYGTPEQLNQFNSLWQKAVESWQAGDYATAQSMFDQAREYGNEISQATRDQIELEGHPAENIRALNQALTALSAAAQGAAAGVSAYDKKGQPVVDDEQSQTANKPVSDSVDYELMLIKRNSGIPLTEAEQQVVNEFGWGDVKKVAGTVASKAAEKTKQVSKKAGRELGQKITARKLSKLWKEAGSPTDSAQVAQVLASAGLDSKGIEAVAKGAGVELPVSSASTSTGSTGPAGSSGSASSSRYDASDRERYDRLMRARKAAGLDDDEESQSAEPAQKPEKKTQVTFPGTEIDFKSGWIKADDLTAADPTVASVLDKVASGVPASELSTQELLAARRKLNIKKPEPATESLREMIEWKLNR